MAKKQQRVKLDNHEAAIAFRETLLSRADGHVHGMYPLWHGWAIVDGFLAGVKWASEHNGKPKATKRKRATQ